MEPTTVRLVSMRRVPQTGRLPCRLMVVAFFAVFVLLLTRSAIRKAGGSDEALCVALGIGSVICFAMMLMASLVHEVEAMRLHATELLMLLGTTIVLVVEGPAKP